MANIKKKIPKQFRNSTSDGHNGFPLYRRRDDNKTVIVKRLKD